jgi:DNA processing protein
MDETNLKQWLTLIFAPRLGPSRIKKIVEHLGSINELFMLDQAQMLDLKLAQSSIKAILNPDNTRVKQHLDWLMHADQHLITLESADFPTLLKNSCHDVSHLFVKGNIDVLQSPQLAMVGSRHPTQMGQHNAFHFAHDLTESGFTITSGLAKGIDACSHQGAVAAHGKTIAVIGTGLDTCYPRENQSLADAILANNGCIVSEYPLGTPVKPYHFPARNRIISGLSQGVLVVEAALKSGSLISAKLASEDNREVFAIPDSIHNTAAKGCHWLIKQGAKLVETIEDITLELNGFNQLEQQKQQSFLFDTSSSTAVYSPQKTVVEKQLSKALMSETQRSAASFSENYFSKESINQSVTQLEAPQQIIFDILSYQPMSIDDIIAASKMSTQDVSVNLLNLELEGLILLEASGYVKNSRY